ncbi:MAG TPA: YqiA/YcfP family alpha/beta fold hydrolase [Anaeromyxobacteraceae bacterium]|nr:YqiA/YcfP family alpha/beta fold hydrolase [Anaeromyxobacteraceae bacterium]
MNLYLHGFASGPGSAKAVDLARRFATVGRRLDVADLTPGPGGFERSTPTSMLAIVDALLARATPPHVLIGSSLGGWLSALTASRDPAVERLILLAPAFNLFERWVGRLGPEQLAAWKRDGLEVDHHATGTRRRIGHAFIEDAGRYPAYPAVRVPTLVIAGRQDETVPLADIERFAARTPSARLLVLEDGHGLERSYPRIFEEARAFMG